MSATPAIRREVHFGERVVRCFADRPSNIYAVLEANAAAAPDADAVVHQDGRISYAEFAAEAARVATGFRQQGIKHGDRVMIMAGNRPEFLFACYAALRVGAVVVPIDIRLHAQELAFIAANCQASALVYEEKLAQQVLAADLPSVAGRLYQIPEAAVARGLFPEVPAGDPRDRHDGGGEEDVAIIVYTSGTTGRPKGAMLTHLNIVHSCMHFMLNEDITSRDRIGVVTPITHVTGLIMGAIAALYAGAAALLLRSFKARAFLEMAAAQRLTQTVMVPAMYSLCLLDDAFDQFDLSAWRLGNYGGAPMPEAAIAALAQKLPHLQLVNGYGSSECCSPAIMIRPGEGVERAYSIGRPLPCADIAIMDENGQEVAPSQSGEIWIAGPMVSPGYWNDAEGTAANFTGGYWRSGDVGMFDEAGYVRLLDRIKDVVNRGGYKIYSAEVENILMAYPGVVEAAVVGRPCPVLGERVHAFVSVSDGSITAAMLRDHCAAHLADYKVPETLDVSTDRLPRSSAGKVMKRDLRERTKDQG